MFELRLVIIEDVFDGILNGNDAHGGGFIDLLDEGAQGGALALAGGAGYEDETARFFDEVSERFGKVQFFELLPMLGNDAKRERLGAFLFAEVGAVTLEAVIKTQVCFALAADCLDQFGRKIFRERIEDGLFGERMESVFWNALQFTLHADDQGLTGLNVKIGGAASLAPLEQLTEPSVGLNRLHAEQYLSMAYTKQQSSPSGQEVDRA